MNRKEFLDATSSTQWATIDELVKQLDDLGYWDAMFNSRALLDSKKQHVRRLMRSMKDENGVPLFANIVTQDENGDEKRVYKQETLFDMTDYRQTVNYHVATSQHHRQMAIGYRNRAFTRYAVQIPLPFEIEAAAGQAA